MSLPGLKLHSDSPVLTEERTHMTCEAFHFDPKLPFHPQFPILPVICLWSSLVLTQRRPFHFCAFISDIPFSWNVLIPPSLSDTYYHLFCARYCARHWEFKEQPDRQSLPLGSHEECWTVSPAPVLVTTFFNWITSLTVLYFFTFCTLWCFDILKIFSGLGETASPRD